MTPPAPKETARRALDSLEDLAREKGLDNVSMRDVAARVGISLSSLQYHYPGKADLIDAFVQRALDHYDRGGAEVMRQVGDAPCLPAVLQYSIEETLKATEGGLFAVLEARAQHDPKTAAAMRSFWRAALEGYADVVKHDHPELSQREVMLAATLIASLVEGLAATHKAAEALEIDTISLTERAIRLSTAIPDQIRRAD